MLVAEAVTVGVSVTVGVLVAGDWTVIVPTIPRVWWNEQWYVNVPGVLKVNEKLLPALTVPESQIRVSDVVVCLIFVVVFVQVTVVPTAMVIGSGTNRRFDVIDTACDAAVAVPASRGKAITNVEWATCARGRRDPRGRRRVSLPGSPTTPSESAA